MFDNIKLLNRIAFLFVVISCCIFIACGLYYIGQIGFPIKQVEVKADIKHVPFVKIKKIILDNLYGNLFTVDIDNLKNSLESIGWIQSVEIKRNFPDSIFINIKEYEPLANLTAERMLSINGDIYKGIDKNYPLFITPDSEVQNLIKIFGYIKQFAVSHNLQVRALQYNGLGFLMIEFNNFTIIMCKGSITENLGLIGQYWMDLLKIKQKLTYINMCYRNAVAVK